MREVSTLKGPGRFQTSVQLAPEARDSLYILSTEMGISRTDVIECAIRNLAREHLGEAELQKLCDPPGSRMAYRIPRT